MAPKKKEAVAKAEKAARAVKKGVMKKVVKKRFSVTFHRPNTFKKEKSPLYARKRYVCVCVCVCVCVRRDTGDDMSRLLRETSSCVHIRECGGKRDMSVVVEVVEALLVTEERRCGFRRKRKTRETDRERERERERETRGGLR